ncbi:hypothetical protein N7470_007084 [Penicillium chermesinum]|nr:hypothetical protein N7470_007084 [Penicillium chermesinum]
MLIRLAVTSAEVALTTCVLITVLAATPPHDGTLSKYYITQADYCYPLPQHMDFEEGALVDSVAMAVQITKVGKVRPNQTVVVFGCGPVGLLCQAVSKAYSAEKVIGIDISQSRAEFAETFGADGVFVPPLSPRARMILRGMTRLHR